MSGKRQGFRKQKGQHRYKHKFVSSCDRCGKTALKWRSTDDGWRLFENERVEHNRLKLHECNPVTADEFDEVTDAQAAR